MKKSKLKIYQQRVDAIKEIIALKNLDIKGKLVARFFQRRQWLVEGKPYQSIEQLVDYYINIKNRKEKEIERNKTAKEKRKKRLDKEWIDKDAQKINNENKKQKKKSIRKKSINNREEIISLHLFLSYEEQLIDKRWRDFREKVFKHNGKLCEKCGSTTNLQIHHIMYKNGHYAWEYNIDEVVVLCGRCHKKIHNL